MRYAFLLFLFAAATPCAAAVNLNTCTYSELLTLPGIGPHLADSILDEHAANGDFKVLNDLGRIKGVGPALLARLAPLIELGVDAPSVAPSKGAARVTTAVVVPTPEKLDLNAATADQLRALRGIGPVLAGRIVEYRERHGAFRGIADLAHVKGLGANRAAALGGQLRVK